MAKMDFSTYYGKYYGKYYFYRLNGAGKNEFGT